MGKWVSTWGQAHTDMTLMSPRYQDCTMRLAVTNCLSGDRIRLRVSNQEGRKPFTITQATVRSSEAPPVAATFSGKPDCVLEPGQEAYSDEIQLCVAPGDLLVISMAFRGPVTSGNNILECVQCSRKGNYADAAQFSTVRRSIIDCCRDRLAAIPALSSVEVLTQEDVGAVVCFGDSITQQSTWTKPLMEACLRKHPGKLTVINKGIGGNRLLSGPGMPLKRMHGKAGRERFDRDVLDEAGVKAVIIAIGTNDFSMARSPGKNGWITAEMLAEETERLVQKCREQGIRVYGTTILPRGGSRSYQEAAEKERLRYNTWIRSTELFDGLIDFDALVRDGDHPDILAFPYNSGDHLHPHSSGGIRMAALAADILLNDLL